jgi:ribosomal protein S18 acetylase RimI-like enzyme
MDETTLPKSEIENQELVIERASQEDAEAMMRLKRAAWLKMYPSAEHDVSVEDIEKKFTEEDIKAGSKNWQEGIAGEPHSGKRQTFVARLNGEVVGFTSPCFEDDQWRIGQLYVTPEFQRRGIGSQLLQEALDWLGPEKDVYLHVLKWNDNAINLYKKFGFQPTSKEYPAEIDEKGRKLLPEIEMLRKSAS